MAAISVSVEMSAALWRLRLAWIIRSMLHLLPVFSLSACNFIDLDRELKELEKFSSIEGSVVRNQASLSPVAVALFTDELRRDQVVNAKLLSASEFTFGVPPGNYVLFAFEDQNQDFQYQPGEPAGVAGVESPIVVVAGKAVTDVAIDLNSEFRPPDSGETATNYPKLWAGRKNVGSIVALDDPRFDRESAKMGLWEPLRFSLSIGPGLYMLEPYDPSRMPVLFVHGINGSPRDWQPMIDQLDRSRFQPWVLTYASGLPLEANASYMYEAITQLQLVLGFDELYLVAHSMGGLLSRAYIGRYGADGATPVRLFVTVSTPWAGQDSAQLGVDHAPAVVPVWRDMAPDSAFLAGLREADLPMTIAHHLLYGYVGQELPRSTANDGVVTVASQLEPAAQSNASGTYGFDSGHTEILRDQRALQMIGQILRETQATNP